MGEAFEFATAQRIVFGAGSLSQVGPIASALGWRALVVAGRDRVRAAMLEGRLAADGVACVAFSVAGEPRVADAERGVELARAEGCDLVVAIGGGSAIDAGKAIAALVPNPSGADEYLEVVGKGRPLERPPLPFVAVPTTAGTGAEVTRNAVLASPEHRVKASLRSPSMLPRAALIDPELLRGLPGKVMAASGMDALAQLIEPFVSRRANPLTDALCREGMIRSARSLRRAFEGSTDAAILEDLALASLMGGLALANAGLGAVHGLAAPIGGMFEAPHGAVCAALLPGVMEANLRAGDLEGPRLRSRYAEVAVLLTGRCDARAEEAVEWVMTLRHDLAIPGLDRWGVRLADAEGVAARGLAASSMKANPVALGETTLAGLIREAL